MTIHLLSDLPYELEIQTCTCRRRGGWKNEWIFSDEWKRPIHKQCMKPTQEQVIYRCAMCEDYFISKTLYPTTQRPDPYMVMSEIYVIRTLTPPKHVKNFKPRYELVKDVFCDDCS
jgi:hypothetical protein